MTPRARAPYVFDLLGQGARDPSAFSLIVANLITIELALLERWDLASVMRIYWWQSVIIGAFHFIRLTKLRHFHMEGPDESGEIIEPTPARKTRAAVAFVLIYGWMHAVYMVFIRQLPAQPPARPYLMAIAVVAFGVNHLFSFLRNIEADARKWRSLPGLVRLAHWRVLPMHAMLILGVAFQTSGLGAPLFLALKTIADLVMHDQEHFMRADPAPRPTSSGGPGRVGRTDQ
jgi:hypothetical protein